MIVLNLKGIPPSSNHMYENNKGGGRRLSDKGKEYKASTAVLLLTEFRKQMMHLKAMAEFPLYGMYQYYLPIYTKAGKLSRLDVTNRHKALEDVIAEAGGFDDKMFVDFRSSKRDAKPGEERTLVIISELDAAPGEAIMEKHGWQHGL